MCRSSCGGFIGMIYHYYRRTACSLFKPARGLNKEWIAVKTVPWFISCSICFLFIETSLFNCRLGSTSTTKRQSVTKAYFIQPDASYPRFPAYHYWVLGKENAWERSHFFFVHNQEVNVYLCSELVHVSKHMTEKTPRESRLKNRRRQGLRLVGLLAPRTGC